MLRKKKRNGHILVTGQLFTKLQELNYLLDHAWKSQLYRNMESRNFLSMDMGTAVCYLGQNHLQTRNEHYHHLYLKNKIRQNHKTFLVIILVWFLFLSFKLQDDCKISFEQIFSHYIPAALEEETFYTSLLRDTSDFKNATLWLHFFFTAVLLNV